jgi:molybdopterin converting factor small subunit
LDVTVRYYAAARAATGVDSERHTGATVASVLDAAVERHPSLAPVLAVASVLADGRVCDRAAPVVDGLTLEVLPPFAGG